MKMKEEREFRAKLAILELRKEKHKLGHPFMINSSMLPTRQCWLEYASGDIHLVTLSKSKVDFDIIKTLSVQEADFVKKSCGF